MNAWCQVTKRLPSQDGFYLVNVLTRLPEGGEPTTPIMLVAEWKDKNWSVPDEWKGSVSHWQRLPNPPKMESLLVK